MPSLIWTAPALADVQRLYRFLAEKNLQAAQRAAQRIRAGAVILEAMPNAGRMSRQFGPEFREWPIRFGASSYIILYRYDGRDISILAVRNSREEKF